MKTYVINLKRCPERKFYMERLLAKFPFLNVEFIEAVDGKELSEEDKNNNFNQDRAFALYGKYLSDGEIGCTLSHQLCYSKIKNGKEDYALILEDDLFISDLNIHKTLEKLHEALDAAKPEVLLLSGDYWWMRKKGMIDKYLIVSIFDASCTQSYIINKNAAGLLSVKKPYFLADDWLLFKNKVALKAVFPHLMDQNRSDFSTEVEATNIGIVRKQLSLQRNIYYYVVAIIKSLLGRLGHFESKSFKDGKI